MGDKDKLTRYQKQQKGKQGQSAVRLQGQLERKIGGNRERVDQTQKRLEGDRIDSIFGFDRMKEVRCVFSHEYSLWITAFYHRIRRVFRGLAGF
jgi:hypothetical protein